MRLRHIAANVLETYDRESLIGLTVEDLMSEGWIAWVESIDRARIEKLAYDRARFAMVDAARIWMNVPRSRDRALATGTLGTMRRADIDGYDDWQRRLEIDHADLLTLFARHFSPRMSSMLVLIAIDGESLERVAEIQGRNIQQVRVAFCQALAKLRRLGYGSVES